MPGGGRAKTRKAIGCNERKLIHLAPGWTQYGMEDRKVVKGGKCREYIALKYSSRCEAMPNKKSASRTDFASATRRGSETLDVTELSLRTYGRTAMYGTSDAMLDDICGGMGGLLEAVGDVEVEVDVAI